MTYPGALIKKKREALNITIEEVSKKLRIRKGLILSIENNNIDEFASKAYYYGYMKQYLKFLNLDYVETSLSTNLPEQELAINIPKIDKINPSSIFVIIAILVSIVIYNLCSDYISEPQPTIEEINVS